MTTFLNLFKSYYLYASVIIFAFILRIINIGDYRRFAMDEVYYVPDSISMMKNGYEVDWVEGGFNNEKSLQLSDAILSGDYNLFSSAFSASHPPLGKMLIGLGMLMFGFDSPVGWRFSAVMAGSLIVALVMILAHIVFKNKYISLASGVLIALDPMAITMSRVSHLDIFLTLFVIIGVIFASLYVNSIILKLYKTKYLYLMAASFALASAVKWSGFYYFIFFVLAIFVLDFIFRKKPNNIRNIISVLFTYIVVSLVYVTVYILSWTSWLINVKLNNGVTIYESFKDLFLLHISFISKHSNLESLHNYNSNAFEWILVVRPTLLNSVFYDNGTMQFISTMPNLIFWIASILSLILFTIIVLRSIKHNILPSLLILAVVAGWAPWMIYYGRTVFQFYTVVFQPYLYIILSFIAYLVYKKIISTNRFSIFKLPLLVLVSFALILSFLLYYGSFVIIDHDSNLSYNIFDTWMSLTQKYGWYDLSQTSISDAAHE